MLTARHVGMTFILYVPFNGFVKPTRNNYKAALEWRRRFCMQTSGKSTIKFCCPIQGAVVPNRYQVGLGVSNLHNCMQVSQPETRKIILTVSSVGLMVLSRVGWYARRKWRVLVRMIGFISTLVTISLNHIFYSAIADLHTHWSSPGTTTKTQEL
jgi:hypothetical protein